MTAADGLFLGVDGGATRCRGRLRDAEGGNRAECEGRAANAYVGFDDAVAAAREVVSRTLAMAGFETRDAHRVSLGFGIAGISRPEDAVRFAAAFSGYAAVSVANDAVTACIGAHAGGDGGLLIVGTGSAGIARVGGRDEVVGGRGFLLGDDGSAARIGADALRASLRACDGLAPSSPLTDAVLTRFHDDPGAMIAWALAAKPGDYGAFAPLVLEAAASGDVVARPIVDAAVRAIAALAGAVSASGVGRIVMVGGLGAAIRPFLPATLDSRLVEPLFDPTDGAILLAGGRLPASRDGGGAVVTTPGARARHAPHAFENDRSSRFANDLDLARAPQPIPKASRC